MTTESHELFLYAINNGDLYRQRITPIINNLKKKIKKGIYNPTLALKLWKYAADDAAQKYTKEFGGSGNKSYGSFNVADRKKAAIEMQLYYGDELTEKTNPRPRIGTRNAKRRSSATGRYPSTRLIKRRRRNAKKGYFPNPEYARSLASKAYRLQSKVYTRANKNIKRIAHTQAKNNNLAFKYKVQVERNDKWITLGAFVLKENAITYGKSMAAKFRGKRFRIYWRGGR